MHVRLSMSSPFSLLTLLLQLHPLPYLYFFICYFHFFFEFLLFAIFSREMHVKVTSTPKITSNSLFVKSIAFPVWKLYLNLYFLWEMHVRLCRAPFPLLKLVAYNYTLLSRLVFVSPWNNVYIHARLSRALHS